MNRSRIFLLSPAHCGGKRAALLAREEAGFPLAERLRSPEGAPIGEVFTFLSGLYFRGKMAYSTAFAAPPSGTPGALVITTDRGLVAPEMPVRTPDIFAFADVPVDPGEPRYLDPLLASLSLLAERTSEDVEIVLLGSVGTPKYLSPLLDALGPRVVLPAPFVGMGDMQRGALMLRAAESGEELPYISAADLAGAPRGNRPRSTRRSAR